MGASEVPTSSSDKWDFSLLTLQHSQQTVTHSSLHSFTQSFQIIITPCGIHSKIFTPSHHPALNQSSTCSTIPPYNISIQWEEIVSPPTTQQTHHSRMGLQQLGIPRLFTRQCQHLAEDLQIL